MEVLTFLLHHSRLTALLTALFLLLIVSSSSVMAQLEDDHYLRERNALYDLKAIFNDHFINNNWTGLQCYADYPPYWYGISCVDGYVTEISLPDMKLTGKLNAFTAFANLTELASLSFKNNSISGTLIDFSWNFKMKEVDLSENEFDGVIPSSLLSLSVLESLQLQGNNLAGKIPAFNQTSLTRFNVSNNKLSGEIPKTNTLQSLPSDSYGNNIGLCGPPSRNPCEIQVDRKDSSDQNQQDKKSSAGSTGVRIPTLFILLIALLVLIVILLFILYCRKARKLRKIRKLMKKDVSEEEDESVEEKIESRVVMNRVVTNRTDDREKGKLVFVGEESGGFEVNDLLKASAEGLGKGMFGNSYKALVEGGGDVVVVKRLRDLKPLSDDEFIKQLKIIAELNHPNLLPLRAYYCSKDQKLVVYKYVHHGNLFDRLYRGRGTKERIPLRWSSRLSMARGIARAMEYLHINTKALNTPIPHGNLKFSNILLDENETVLVSDYGLTSLVALPIAAQRMVIYKSPEYQTTKKVSRKSDVWSYGCVLLEILTGRMSVHTAPAGVNGVDLCGWVHRAVREEWTGEIFDVEISVMKRSQEMLKLLQIAMRCCDRSPEKRPEMTQVVREVEDIKMVDSEEDYESSMQSLTDESISTSVSGIISEER